MPYDEKIDTMITAAVADWGTERKAMFGGTCHMLGGKMFCGVWRNFLIARIGEAKANEALGEEAAMRRGVRVFDITGKPMKGWVMVDGASLSPEEVDRWVNLSREFVETLTE